MLDKQIKEVLSDMDFLRRVYSSLLTLLPSSFDLTDKKVLPYGLKPHTRSVSWLVEQVINQQTKYYANALSLNSVEIDMPDTSLHDCVIKTNAKDYYVNIKIHNMGGKENKNDISAVEKLYTHYVKNPEYNLIYVCFGISFKGITISFDKRYLQIFSPQFLPIYVNPRNDKIQAFYEHKPQIRTREEFLTELASSSKSIKLK